MNNKKGKAYILVVDTIPVKKRDVGPMKARDGGHNISLIQAPMDRLSRSPQEVQKPQSQSQFSS